MTRLHSLAAALAAVALVSFGLTAQDAAKQALIPDGKYTVAYGRGSMQRIGIVEIKTADGKTTATKLAQTPTMPENYLTFGTLSIDNGVVKLPVNLGPNKLAFEGKPDPKNPKRFLGTFGDADITMRGELEGTELAELGRNDVLVPTKSKTADAIKELREASNKLRAEARIEKDAEAKKKLLDEATELTKKNAAEIAKLEAGLATAGEGYASADAAQRLLAGAGRTNASEADVTAWMKAIEDEAAAYGPKIVDQARATAVATLIRQEKYGKLALPYALEAANAKGLSLKAKSAALAQLQKAQSQAGLTEDAAATANQIAGMEAELDKEYLATVPPFKPTPFAGRKDKAANKVAVLELFTGAQCPPCVAADVAFDALAKSYDHKDLVLLQYHEHIPGPDPLTNADSVARFSYYGKLNKQAFGGTPSTAFNGKPAAGGGGGMAGSEGKYAAYTKVIDAVLNESTDVALRGTAKLAGDELKIALEVAGVKELPETAVLRLVLTEENIKYVGGNGLRFHHHVVRSLLGTADGVKLGGLKDGKYEVSKSLNALKAELTEYLDGFAKSRPFPYPARPLDLKGLKVVAMIQDDKTGEIFQATQLDVAE